MPRTVTFRQDLETGRATSGRRVEVTVVATVPSYVPRVQLGYAWRQLATALVYDGELTETAGLEVRKAATGNQSVDFTVRGRLRSNWSSVEDLREFAASTVTRNATTAGASVRADAADVSALDLELETVEKQIYGKGEGFFDPQGDVNSDGTLGYQGIYNAGLKGAGEGVGKLWKGIGEGSSSALGGVFSGLGPGWSLAFLVLGALFLAVVGLWLVRPFLGA